jgi:uncharacterized membrane protein
VSWSARPELVHLTHRHLLTAVLALAVATAVGLFALWPSASEVPSGDQGTPPVLVDATITTYAPYTELVEEITGVSGQRARMVLRLTSGDRAEEVVVLDTGLDGYPPFSAGDRVQLSLSTFGDGEEQWFIVDIVRGGSLWLLLAVFVGAVLAIGRWQGARSLLGLGLSLLLITQFIVPAILAGRPPFLVALVGSAAVLLVSVYLAHGPSVMTSAAVVGTMAALAITIVLGALFVDLTSLTGFASEEAVTISMTVVDLDLRGLVLAGMVIAALGVLDDVTVTQASTVFALHRANPDVTARHLASQAMHVGRDHIASTVNTLVLAYVGASLGLLLVFSTGGLPLGDLLTSEILAEEIVKTLVGSLGIIAAVPLTTLLAAAVAVGPDGPGAPDADHVSHAH